MPTMIITPFDFWDEFLDTPVHSIEYWTDEMCDSSMEYLSSVIICVEWGATDLQCPKKDIIKCIYEQSRTTQCRQLFMLDAISRYHYILERVEQYGLSERDVIRYTECMDQLRIDLLNLPNGHYRILWEQYNENEVIRYRPYMRFIAEYGVPRVDAPLPL